MSNTTVVKKESLRKEKTPKGAYLLGEESDGTKVYLRAASWSCGWYWGFGYLQTKDSHSHIEGLFGKQEEYNFDKKGWFLTSEYIHNIYDSPKFVKTTFTKDEGWILSELFKSFYTLKATAEFYHTGGAHITTNPLRDKLKNEAEETRINKELLPAIFEEIYKILKP